jgi:transcriptional regulator with XRE-family HTH domain
VTDTSPSQQVLAAWGAALKVEREDQKLTQIELATRSGLDQGSISRAERGKGASLDTLLAMALALGVRLTDLAERQDVA